MRKGYSADIGMAHRHNCDWTGYVAVELAKDLLYIVTIFVLRDYYRVSQYSFPYLVDSDNSPYSCLSIWHLLDTQRSYGIIIPPFYH
jgi:hypothetical protein